MEGNIFLELSILLILLILARVLYLIHKTATGYSRIYDGKRNGPAKTVICLGSGGHTTEILNLVNQMDFTKYNPRSYIVANNDETSFSKAKQLESDKGNANDACFRSIPRSRIVSQSYLTSILTTLYSTMYCIPMMFTMRPDLILCNGPGTCIPLCLIAFILKTAFICDTKIVFVESYCRTKTFSLSGKILFYIADNVLVQWPSLRKKLKRADYIGHLL